MLFRSIKIGTRAFYDNKDLIDFLAKDGTDASFSEIKEKAFCGIYFFHDIKIRSRNERYGGGTIGKSAFRGTALDYSLCNPGYTLLRISYRYF